MSFRFVLPIRTSENGSLTQYHGDVIRDACDPSGREVLKFWNHDRYLSMSEMLQEAEKQNKKRKKKDK